MFELECASAERMVDQSWLDAVPWTMDSDVDAMSCRCRWRYRRDAMQCGAVKHVRTFGEAVGKALTGVCLCTNSPSNSSSNRTATVPTPLL